MLQQFVNIILAVSLVGGAVPHVNLKTRGISKYPMPSFEDGSCPTGVTADLCINVDFPSDTSDVLVLTKTTKTIYEGFLNGDVEVQVVMLESIEDNERVINFNSAHVPHCNSFDVDLTANTVNCVRAGFDAENDDDKEGNRNRAITDENTNGPIIPLGNYYPNGITVNILFTFDNKFYNDFDGQSGISGDEYMSQVMVMVKNAFLDTTLKNRIGTTVNVVGTTARYAGDFSGNFPGELTGLAQEGGDYNLFTYITHPGAGGVAWGGQACSGNAGNRISFNNAYGPNQCNYYNPPDPIDCTRPLNRITLTAETVAHELGHSLGMDHDFKQDVYDNERRYEYRQYEEVDCRGLMDYVDDGVGWSACSARDFSRYLTNGGTNTPCLNYDASATAAPTNPTAAPTTAAPTTAAPTTAAPTTQAPTTQAPDPSPDCKKDDGTVGDGTTQGTCAAGEICHVDGTCEGTSEPCDTAALCAIVDCTKPNANELCPGTCKYCTNINVRTERWGYENSYVMDACMSPSSQYDDASNYSEECCLAAGTYNLDCKCSYGDGWHGGYLEIDGVKYCDDFTDGSIKTVQVNFGLA